MPFTTAQKLKCLGVINRTRAQGWDPRSTDDSKQSSEHAEGHHMQTERCRRCKCWRTQHRHNTISAKTSVRHFVAMDKTILKFTQKGQGTKTANINFKQKNTMRGISLPNFQIYYSYSNQVCSISGERQTDQWNRMENPGTDPHKQLNDFDRTAQEFAGIKMTFPTNGARATGCPLAENMSPLN